MQTIEQLIARAESAEREVERLTKQIKDDNRSYGCELRDPYGTIWEQATKDHARAERAAERARLDWLMAGGVCMVQHTGGFHVSRLHYPVSRAAIDAAMKEGK